MNRANRLRDLAGRRWPPVARAFPGPSPKKAPRVAEANRELEKFRRSRVAQ